MGKKGKKRKKNLTAVFGAWERKIWAIPTSWHLLFMSFCSYYRHKFLFLKFNFHFFSWKGAPPVRKEKKNHRELELI